MIVGDALLELVLKNRKDWFGIWIQWSVLAAMTMVENRILKDGS